MSNKEKVTEQQEKTMTKYDLKMQKRKEEKERIKREKRNERIVWAVIIVAVVCLIASFPIRSYMAVKETFVRINGEDISRVEFDYNYNIVKNNFVNTYANIFSMMGVDGSVDLSTMQYSDTMTMEEYIEEETVKNIVQGKALKAEAEAAGFTYDVEQEYAEFAESINIYAAAAEISVKDYVKQAYGSYATMDRIEGFIKEALYTNAYTNQITEAKTPSDAEIQEYYEANKDTFESVDYYLTTVGAEVTTESTEEETEKAMADAKALADATDATTGTLEENVKYDNASELIRDWLFDASRAEGDTTVIEDTAGNQYYVLSFVKRYLDETPSADVRIISTDGIGAQVILEEWKKGEATEESFAALADEHNATDAFAAEGGLYEGVYPSGTMEEIGVWLSEEGRVAGDTTAITSADGTSSHALYYVGPNEPEWKLTAKSLITTSRMEEYLEEISKGIEVDDFKGNLEYIEIRAAEAAAAETGSTEAE